MASPRTCLNPPSTGEDELARGAQGALTGDSGTPAPPSHAATLALAPVLGSAPSPTDALFKQL